MDTNYEKEMEAFPLCTAEYCDIDLKKLPAQDQEELMTELRKKQLREILNHTDLRTEFTDYWLQGEHSWSKAKLPFNEENAKEKTKFFDALESLIKKIRTFNLSWETLSQKEKKILIFALDESAYSTYIGETNNRDAAYLSERKQEEAKNATILSRQHEINTIDWSEYFNLISPAEQSFFKSFSTLQKKAFNTLFPEEKKAMQKALRKRAAYTESHEKKQNYTEASEIRRSFFKTVSEKEKSLLEKLFPPASKSYREDIGLTGDPVAHYNKYCLYALATKYPELVKNFFTANHSDIEALLRNASPKQKRQLLEQLRIKHLEDVQMFQDKNPKIWEKFFNKNQPILSLFQTGEPIFQPYVIRNISAIRNSFFKKVSNPEFEKQKKLLEKLFPEPPETSLEKFNHLTNDPISYYEMYTLYALARKYSSFVQEFLKNDSNIEDFLKKASPKEKKDLLKQLREKHLDDLVRFKEENNGMWERVLDENEPIINLFQHGNPKKNTIIPDNIIYVLRNISAIRNSFFKKVSNPEFEKQKKLLEKLFPEPPKTSLEKFNHLTNDPISYYEMYNLYALASIYPKLVKEFIKNDSNIEDLVNNASPEQKKQLLERLRKQHLEDLMTFRNENFEMWKNLFHGNQPIINLFRYGDPDKSTIRTYNPSEIETILKTYTERKDNPTIPEKIATISDKIQPLLRPTLIIEEEKPPESSIQEEKSLSWFDSFFSLIKNWLSRWFPPAQNKEELINVSPHIPKEDAIIEEPPTSTFEETGPHKNSIMFSSGPTSTPNSSPSPVPTDPKTPRINPHSLG